jgi:pimeloyl-ACP methyl ester carboxylesterase
MPSSTIPFSDLTLHYTRAGTGSTPLLLVHGFTDAGMCWSPFVPALADAFDIYLPDLRGHGRSSRVQPGQTVDNAADLAGFIDALGLGPVLAVGHSMGAAAVADLGMIRPDLVRALVLEDPPWSDGPRASSGPNPWYDWLRTLPEQTLESIAAKGRADSPTWAEAEIGPWAESKMQFDVNFLDVARVRRDWREVVAALSMPALVVTAETELGAIVPPAVAEEIAALNPRARVARVSGAGHCIRREATEAYTALVRGFLLEHASRSNAAP